MSPSDNSGGFRPGALILPGILVLLGVLLLLANFGLVNPNWWFHLFRLWPLLLILAGVAIIAGRVSGWGAALLGLVVVVILAFAGLYAAFAAGGVIRGEPTTESWEAPLGTAKEAEVVLRLGAGTLDLGSLPADSPNLVEAGFTAGAGRSAPGRTVERSDSGAVVRITSGEGARFPFNFDGVGEEWDLRLHPAPTLDIRLQGGASRSRLDLSALKVRDLEVDVGASEASIRFPEGAGATQARIKGGAARLDLEVPSGVAARIDARLGVSSVSIDTTRFPQVGGVYLSPDYDTAANKIDFRVESGVSSVTIR